MSLGYTAHCEKELEDERIAVYSYHAENWNLPHEQAERLEAVEGAFTIEKSSLDEPEIHHKRDGSEKRVVHMPDIARHIQEGGITIDRLSGVDQWEREQGKQYPRCLMRTLTAVYERYMEEGRLPDTASFIQ